MSPRIPSDETVAPAPGAAIGGWGPAQRRSAAHKRLGLAPPSGPPPVVVIRFWLADIATAGMGGGEPGKSELIR